MKTKLPLTILVYLSCCFVLKAQEVPVLDSLPTVLDSLGFPIQEDLKAFSNETQLPSDGSLTLPTGVQVALDSLGILDSLGLVAKLDSITPPTSPTTFNSRSTVAYSKDSLDQEVESFGKDSMRYDIANKEIHLWGEAYVIYGDIKLEADYIVYNWTENIVTAEYSQDKLGVKKGLPKFTDKDQDFTASKMRFNFKTKKGVVLEAVSTQSGVIVHGGKVKIFSEGSDSLQQHQHIYSKDALFTTCNHPDPHFGIRSRKQAMTEKVVIVGPSNIELGGVPTPLWIPFGLFPLKIGERTGLIFPQSYEDSDQLGFGLNGVGWYFPINEYMNLTVTGRIYTRGTWGLNARSDYRKNYKYNGNFNLGYTDLKVKRNFRKVSDKSFSIDWRHSQDPKAHPTMKFNGGINFQTNNYQSINNNDAASVQQNTTRSNLNFSKTFPDKPFTLTAGLSHSQNTKSREVIVSLPNVDFRMNRIFPFKSKNPIAEDKWYDKIGIDYHGQAQNKFTSTDTTVFTRQTFNDARFGAKHEATANASFQILKYFNLSPNINYTEVWHFKTLNRTFDPTPTIDTILVDSVEMTYLYDTTAYGTVTDVTENGFKPLRLFTSSVSLNTKLFGTMLFKRGWLRGLRHTATPSISMSYTPDYTTDAWDYFRTVQQSTQPDVLDNTYSIFTGGVYSDQPSSAGEQFNMNYSLNSIFEGKYFAKKDSTLHRFKIFDSVTLGGSHNFAADSLKWSLIRMGGRATVIPGITAFTINATFDPYIEEYNEKNTLRRVNKLALSENKRLARFDFGEAGLTTRFTVKKIAEMISGDKKGKSSTSGDRPRTDNGPKGIANESLMSLIDNFSISHDIKFRLESIGAGETTRDTFTISTHSITIRGDLQLTENWRLTLGQISYNFKQNQLVYPTLALYRNLHCWEMGINWSPERNFFSFSLKVKPGALDFIKVPYGRNQVDGTSLGRGGF